MLFIKKEKKKQILLLCTIFVSIFKFILFYYSSIFLFLNSDSEMTDDSNPNKIVRI